MGITPRTYEASALLHGKDGKRDPDAVSDAARRFALLGIRVRTTRVTYTLTGHCALSASGRRW
jgi:hypothetical protein